MMNNSNTGPVVVVAKAAPWTVSINGVEVGTFPSRKAAREAGKAAREGKSYDDIGAHVHDNVVDAIVSDPKAFRTRLGLTRADMATRLRISRYELDLIEKGTKELSGDHIGELMAAV